jgi:ribosomal-protein-alanine N-acetyltransferase
VIRAAAPDDVPAIAGLERDNLGADAWSERLVAEGVHGRLPTMAYLVAEADGEVVGYAAASIVADIAELQRIAVDPDHRRTGLATELVRAVTDRARRAEADRLLLEVREDNAGALAFYAAAGFAEIDRRRRYYRDGTTAVVLALSLGPAGDVPAAG